MPSTRYSCWILIKPEIFSTDFRKITQIPNFMKIRRVGAELFSRGRTDRHDEANSRFRRFTNAPKQITDQSSLRYCARLCASIFAGRPAQLLTSRRSYLQTNPSH